jgi:peptide/nickel transport system substrate-binding protein
MKSKFSLNLMIICFVVLSFQATMLFAGGQKEKGTTVQKEPAAEKTQAASQPRYGGTLNYGYVSEIDTLDQHQSQNTVTRSILTLIWEPLVDWDKNLNLKPGLAESWEPSQDGRTWTFNLRKGVKFHHGKEMEAKDVKFTIERVKNPKLAASFRALLEVVTNVEIVDKYTVKFHLSRPDGALASKLVNAIGIMPSDITPFDSRIGITDKISGTGPYKYVEWKKDDYIKLVKNENYWQKGIPYVDTLMMKPIPDANVRLMSLRAGDIDVIEWVPFEEIKKMQANPPQDITVEVGPAGAETGYICLNTLEPPFNDKRVRQAVAYAIEKNAINQGAWRGFGQVVNQPFAHESEWYVQDYPDKYGKGDFEKAKQLLKEAGYPDGLDLVWGTTTGYQYMFNLAQVGQESLRKAGIRIKLDVYDWSGYVAKMPTMQFKIWNTGVPGMPDPVHFYPLIYKKDSPFHWIAGMYDNPELDRLLDQAEAETVFEKRKELYRKVLEIVEEEVPLVYTTTGPIGFGWRKIVHNFVPHTNAFVHFYQGGLAFAWKE